MKSGKNEREWRLEGKWENEEGRGTENEGGWTKKCFLSILIGGGKINEGVCIGF